jgi:hypothetical protein
MKTGTLAGKFGWSRLRAWANSLRGDVVDNTPTAGHYITVDDSPGGGKRINVDTAALAQGGVGGDRVLSLQVCISGVTKTVKFVVQGDPT